MSLYNNILSLLKENRKLKRDFDKLKEEVEKRDIKIYNRDLINEDLRLRESSYLSIIETMEKDKINTRDFLFPYTEKLRSIGTSRICTIIRKFNKAWSVCSEFACEIDSRLEKLSSRVNLPQKNALKTKVYKRVKIDEKLPIVNESIYDKIFSELEDTEEADIKNIPSRKWENLKNLATKRFGEKYFIYCFGGKLRIVLRDGALKELEKTKLMLRGLRSKFSGSPCVIIGNGPSLNKHDFTYLKNIFTIGSNYIYLNKEKMTFLPNIVSATNFLVVEQRLDDFLSLDTNVVLPLYMKKKVGSHQNIFYLNINHEEGFSENIDEWSSTRSTVTYFNLQLAYGLGFNEVFLIGVDNTYSQSVKGEGKVLDQKEDDSNHFAKEYFRGLKWQSADTDKMEAVYRTAKMFYDLNDRKVYNAGIGGNLNCFERISYKDIKETVSVKKSSNRAVDETLFISVNPDLSNKFGHYLQFDQCFSQALLDEGKSLFCLCNKEIDYIVNSRYGRLIPCFSKKSHEVGMRDYGDGGIVNEFQRELQDGIDRVRSVSGVEADNFAIFMYCGSFQHLVAIKEIAKINSKYSYYINVFFPSFERCFNRNSDKLGESVLLDIEDYSNIVLLFGTDSYRDYFHERFHVNGRILPYSPTTPIQLLTSDLTKEKEKYVTLLGNMRPEKGKSFSLDIIAKILEDRELMNYKIRARKPRTIDVLEEVEALRIIANGRIDWIEGDVDIYEFAEFVKSSHINIITYEKMAFEMRPSGVFADSIMGEVPVLVPDETDMARVVNRFGNGETFPEGDVDSVIDNVKRIIGFSEQYREATVEAKDYWEKENSWSKFIGLLGS